MAALHYIQHHLKTVIVCITTDANNSFHQTIDAHIQVDADSQPLHYLNLQYYILFVTLLYIYFN